MELAILTVALVALIVRGAPMGVTMAIHASRASDYVPGQTIFVDGGFSAG